MIDPVNHQGTANCAATIGVDAAMQAAAKNASFNERPYR